jgi:hypothetical protein
MAHNFGLHVWRIAALPVPLILQRTKRYASIRYSPASCTALKHEAPMPVAVFGIYELGARNG